MHEVFREAGVTGLAARSSARALMRAATAAGLAGLICAAALCAAVPASPALAQAERPEKAGKLPRFASLRSGEVNVRAGPGPRYPVEWVLTRRNMPVEVVAEYDTWRQVRDGENTLGWVHQAMLSAQRYVLIVAEEVQPLLRRPDDAGPAAAMVEPGVVG
ncbi:MAG: SH3 domain-containing protein, partial [Rhodospirillales bacterium]